METQNIKCVQKIGCEKLEEIVEADETFFYFPKKAIRIYSSEQIPVITSCDRNSHYIVGVAGGGRINAPEVEKTFGKYVDENNTL